jgi:hypothetical protein
LSREDREREREQRPNENKQTNPEKYSEAEARMIL